MKLPILLLASALLAMPAFATENPASVSLSDVDKQLAGLDAAIKTATPLLPAQKVQGLQAQATTLTQRVEKVKTGGKVTPAEHDALLAAIENQQRQIQAALPQPRPVDPAAVPGGGATGYVQGTYGSTTTIAPNGDAVMSNGPVVNGTPQGETVVQPAFAQPTVR